MLCLCSDAYQVLNLVNVTKDCFVNRLYEKD